MDPLLFAGRLHPALVHLPIGLLVAVALTEFFAWTRRSDDLSRLARTLLVITALAAVVTAASGWQLAGPRAEDDELLFRHRWSGVAFAVLLVLIAWRARSVVARRLGVLVALMLMTITAHFGGGLTHGTSFVTQYAPAWLQRAADVITPSPAATSAGAGGTTIALHDSDSDFERVRAAFEARCFECHGPLKAKKGLRLDRPDGLASVIVPGDAPASELFVRVTLPIAHMDAMPPKGRRLDDDTVLALMHWINAGADNPAGTSATVDAARAATEATLETVRVATGALVLPTGTDSAGPLRVDFARGEGAVDGATLAAIEPVAARVVEISFAGRTIPGAALARLPALPALDRLHLERTDLDDDKLATLVAKAPELTYLNLHSTRITDSGLATLEALANLRRLVLFGTDVGDEARAAFADSHPDVHVTGDLLLEPPAGAPDPADG